MEGVQQSGIAFDLKIADLAHDGQIVQAARETAEDILAGNPQIAGVREHADRASEMPLDESGLALLAQELNRRFAKKIDWSLIS